MALQKNSNQRQFHWVNKVPESSQLSRSQGQEASSILKFVQKNRNTVYRRRQRPNNKTTHDFVAFETDVKPEPPELAEDDIEAADAARGKRDALNGIRSMQSRWRVNVPTNNLMKGSGIDPFASTVIPMTDSTFSLLQYTKASMLTGSGGYKVDIFSDQLRPFTDLYQAAVGYAFKEMVRSKHIIYPMLAVFSRRMRTLNDHPFAQAQDPDRYLLLATHAVRTSIAEHINDKDAMTYIATGVHFLICAAGLAGRFQESNMHISAFLKFLPYIDTNTLVGYWEWDTACSLDMVNAASTGEEPTIKIANSDPGPMPMARKVMFQDKLNAMKFQMCQTVDPAEASADITRYRERVVNNKFDTMQNPAEDLEAQLGSGLEAAFRTGVLSELMQPVLENLFDCLLVAKVIWRAPGLATRDDARWLCRKSKATLHELISLTGSKKIDTSTFFGQQAECLRQTLVILLMSAQSRLLRLSRKEQAARLKTALTPIVRLDWNSPSRRKDAKPQSVAGLHADEHQYVPNEMLLWMCMTGHWAASEAPEETWFAGASVAIAQHRLGLTDYNDLHRTMTKYLYSKTVQRESLMAIAKELQP
ncbi:hypothetical protein PMZ80_008724 [Knufia obscura]|uniref:Tachykinin family protein n=1 Tax=Knufia obscura TaxID=1635080 RepID=A0ABR0RFR3_9EURO|nr:hypothetical protein PMZ80_008724 [Knufia obscura]